LRGIDQLVRYARELSVNLGIEPMNPIYAADRGVISTLRQALDIAERFETDDVGVVVDTFTCGGNQGLPSRCSAPADALSATRSATGSPLAGGHPAGSRHDGRRPHRLRRLHQIGRRAGYRGDIEVEIFNADLWAAPPADVVDTMAKRYLELVQPYLNE
jgi:hypothetical protein